MTCCIILISVPDDVDDPLAARAEQDVVVADRLDHVRLDERPPFIRLA
jgi:hypothetical protein